MRQVIVVGSGPAGYTAAIYAARARLAPLVIASAVEFGGELMKTTEVENFPGFPDGIQGPDLMTNLQRQAERFGAEIVYDDVVRFELDGPVKRIHLGNGDVHEALAVIYATGSAYRTLGLDDEARLSGYGVSWCATCDGAFFRGKEVAVVGGGDSAMEEATFLTRFAETVHVIHRKDSLRASATMQERARTNPKVRFHWNQEVASIHGTDLVTGVGLRNTIDGSGSTLDLSGVFIAIGADPRTHLVHGQLELTAEGTIAVDGRSSRTNLAGVFAAGDVIDPTYKQAATAAGSGVVAALDAEHYLASLPEKENPMSTAREVTDATFGDEVIDAETPTLVDFWAPWCGPCRALSPILDQIAAEHPGKLDVVKVNVDENMETALAYQVTSLPALQVFRGGEVVKRMTGAKNKPALEAELAEFLA